MLEFKPLSDFTVLKDYFSCSEIGFCDITVGTKYLWQNEFINEYAIFDGTLILKESCPDYKNAFYFPMGKNVSGALEEIEKYCVFTGLDLQFCCIDNKTASFLADNYFEVSISNDRNWSDYIYLKEKISTYSGRNLNGKRNHVNKFKKTYEYTVNKITKQDFLDIKTFLLEFERGTDFSVWSEREEIKKVYDYIEKHEELGQVGACIRVDGKVVAISLGEVVGDTLYVHVEKALKTYDGVYPTMAKEFASLPEFNGVKYVNREEDCGDAGLRISKLSYHPLEIKEKNLVKVKSQFDRVTYPFFLKTERLTIENTSEDSKIDYYNLSIDDDLNKLWGYDYREDLNGREPTPEYFMEFMSGLIKKREEYSLMVKKEGEVVGEIVLHNFSFKCDVEVGFRFFKTHQKKGYARESVLAVIQKLKDVGFKKIKSRCHVDNIPSYNLITALGLKQVKKTKTHIFFETNI